MSTAEKVRPLVPQINSVLSNYLAEGRHIISIRMAPRDMARMADEVGIQLPRKPRLIRSGKRIIRSLVWDLKNGYIFQSVTGPIQVMPDLSVIPGHIEMSDAESAPLYGLQSNN